jgi:hypothetical protein
MIPSSTRWKGTNSPSLSAAYADGKQVKSSTTTKISQTWFASHTGPIAWAIASRCASRRGPRAKASQIPPPKSAPASTA